MPLDFVPKNSGKTDLCVTESDGLIIFYVKDNGIGMSEKSQKQSFKKFLSG